MRRHTVAGIALLAAAATFVGCGGGGHSGLPGTAPGNTAAMSSAVFKLSIPLRTAPSSTARKPQYISPNTQSMTIAVGPQGGPAGPQVVANLTTSDPSCTQAGNTLTCAIAAAAPVGTDTFTIITYAGQNGTGSVLSSATVSGTVSLGQANSIPLTLNGTVASINLTIVGGLTSIPGGFPATVPVYVTAYDASGATIVGPGSYTNPITLSNQDTSGVTQLSETTVNTPSDNVTLTYNPTDANGGLLNAPGPGETTIGATAAGVQAVTATFQTITDRFFGYNHPRTLTGSATVTTITYNASATPSPNPSAWSYTINDVLTVHSNTTANGVSGLLDSNEVVTYTQTAPATSPPVVETVTRDTYRGGPLAAPFVLYDYAETESDGNSSGVTSPLTGYDAGSTLVTYTWPNSGTMWQDDVLPHTSATWSNTEVPYTETWSGSQVATAMWNLNGTTSFIQTVPSAVTQYQNADGSASKFSGGVTTSVGLESGGTFPVAEETTSPAPGPTSTYTPSAAWLPGGAAPVTLPVYKRNYTEAPASVPGGCVGSGVVTGAVWAITDQETWLRLPVFQYRTTTRTDYFVDGVGFVCETSTEVENNYRFTTGVISSQTTITEMYGVPGTSSLGLVRRR
jgi:hypothetical protein